MSPLTLHQIVASARGRRRDLGWSQQDLATRAGVSRGWVHVFERGDGGGSLEAVMRVLDVLGLPLEFTRDAVALDANALGLDELLDQHRT